MSRLSYNFDSSEYLDITHFVDNYADDDDCSNADHHSNDDNNRCFADTNSHCDDDSNDNCCSDYNFDCNVRSDHFGAKHDNANVNAGSVRRVSVEVWLAVCVRSAARTYRCLQPLSPLRVKGERMRHQLRKQRLFKQGLGWR